MFGPDHPSTTLLIVIIIICVAMKNHHKNMRTSGQEQPSSYCLLVIITITTIFVTIFFASSIDIDDTKDSRRPKGQSQLEVEEQKSPQTDGISHLSWMVDLIKFNPSTKLCFVPKSIPPPRSCRGEYQFSRIIYSRQDTQQSRIRGAAKKLPRKLSPPPSSFLGEWH